MKKKPSRPKSVQKPMIPKLGTTASRDFFVSWTEISEFFNFVLRLVGHLEAAGDRAHKALVETAPDQAERERLVRAWDLRVGPADQLANYRQIFLEIILARHIENYLNYISGLLFEIYTQRPETLRSGEMLELSTVLSHDNMNDLVKTIAERKVESLSYRSFQDLSGYFEDRFGLVLFPEDEIDSVVEAIETRNISVHNRCIMNERYIKRTGKSRSLLGKQRELFLPHIHELAPMFLRGVRRLDKDARRKLKMRGTRFDIKELYLISHPPIPRIAREKR